MQYFTKDTIKFFENLSKNNYREWFHEHRDQYIESVKDPFDRYLTDLIAEVRRHDKKVTIEPKQAKFRINRDVRFRKNKEPYKLHVSSVISPEGRKDRIYPGLYTQIWLHWVNFWSGRYSLEKEELYALRAYIIKHPRKFRSVINDPALTQLFGELQWNKNKRIPKEFQKKAEREPLIYNKQFYFYKKYPAKMMLRDDLLQWSMQHRHATRDRDTYVSNAIKKWAHQP